MTPTSDVPGGYETAFGDDPDDVAALENEETEPDEYDPEADDKAFEEEQQ